MAFVKEFDLLCHICDVTCLYRCSCALAAGCQLDDLHPEALNQFNYPKNASAINVL